MKKILLSVLIIGFLAVGAFALAPAKAKAISLNDLNNLVDQVKSLAEEISNLKSLLGAQVSLTPIRTSALLGCPPITPSLTVLSPNGGEYRFAGTSYTFKWSTCNLPTNATNIQILLHNNDYGPADSSRVTILAQNALNDGQETLTIPSSQLNGRHYTVVISFIDSATQSYTDESDVNFTIAQTAQRVGAATDTTITTVGLTADTFVADTTTVTTVQTLTAVTAQAFDLRAYGVSSSDQVYLYYRAYDATGGSLGSGRVLANQFGPSALPAGAYSVFLQKWTGSQWVYLYTGRRQVSELVAGVVDAVLTVTPTDVAKVGDKVTIYYKDHTVGKCGIPNNVRRAEIRLLGAGGGGASGQAALNNDIAGHGGAGGNSGQISTIKVSEIQEPGYVRVNYGLENLKCFTGQGGAGGNINGESSFFNSGTNGTFSWVREGITFSQVVITASGGKGATGRLPSSLYTNTSRESSGGAGDLNQPGAKGGKGGGGGAAPVLISFFDLNAPAGGSSGATGGRGGISLAGTGGQGGAGVDGQGGFSTRSDGGSGADGFGYACAGGGGAGGSWEFQGSFLRRGADGGDGCPGIIEITYERPPPQADLHAF